MLFFNQSKTQELLNVECYRIALSYNRNNYRLLRICSLFHSVAALRKKVSERFHINGIQSE